MKHSIARHSRRLALACLLTGFAGAAPAADVGVSISIGEPGFYGQIDIGTMRPQVVYAEPVIIRRERVVRGPIYLRVPPGHEKHWDKHCDEYNACGAPVYFVQDRWYNDDYAPAYRRSHGGGGDHDHGNSGHDDDDHGGGHGNGNGNGKGKGKGH